MSKKDTSFKKGDRIKAIEGNGRRNKIITILGDTKKHLQVLNDLPTVLEVSGDGSKLRIAKVFSPNGNLTSESVSVCARHFRVATPEEIKAADAVIAERKAMSSKTLPQAQMA